MWDERLTACAEEFRAAMLRYTAMVLAADANGRDDLGQKAILEAFGTAARAGHTFVIEALAAQN